MKSSKLMIAIALLVLVAPVMAQTGTVRAIVPFNFNLGQQTLAAGEYRVIVERATLQLAPMDAAGIYCGRFSYVTPGSDQGVNAKLVFHRYGSHYFLSEVWTGDRNRGEQLMISSTERELARATKPASTTVLAEQVSK